MQTISRLDTLRVAVAALKNGGKPGNANADCPRTVALVPTMGALHDGHIALVRAAKARADHVVVSIFVNPLQFGPNEDLDAYPRQLEADARLLRAAGAELLWAPTVEQMYPAGFATTVSVGGLDAMLCGTARPGHFDGVATVVTKLFNQVQPDMAFFGEKDWQQLAIIRRCARDLDLAHPRAEAIIGVPTVREADGLAMSSRNKYLSADQRIAAGALNRGMAGAIDRIVRGEDAGPVLADLREQLRDAGFHKVDYADLRDAETLVELARHDVGRPARLLVAAHIGKARLLDNMAVEPVLTA
ncbi:pantoate--beta-alanine ligase [Novosphingobium sp.]|uniref:pantoate--beta-alanine ligase n=1 Tax=Novosphingobium sp. TaxID=1874826 RepID=UPI0038B99EDB